MNKQLVKSLFIPLAFVLSTCEILDITPQDRVDLQSFYQSPSDAESGLIGVYFNSLRELYVRFMYVNSRSSDDITANPTPQDDPVVYRPNLTLSNPGDANAIWNLSYKAIAQVNLLIDRVPQIPAFEFNEIDADGSFGSVPPEIGTMTRQDAVLGEAYFLRAFLYYHLVHYWGDVPLILEFPSSSDPVDNRIPRTAAREVMDQIMVDLDSAMANLPLNHDYYPEGGTATDQILHTKGRATQAAARLLKARMHQYDREWQQAINEVDYIINSNQYSVTSRWVNIFDPTTAQQNSSESIWEIQTNGADGEFDNTGGYAWFHQDGQARRGATQDAFNAFEGNEENPMDVRQIYSMGVSAADPTIIYAVKFSNDFPWWDNADPFNFVPMRLTEALLIRAEALHELSPLNEESLSILNTIRARSQDLDYATGPIPGIAPLRMSEFQNADDFTRALRAERRRELMFEGQRWFDLLRYDHYDEMDGSIGKRAAIASYLIQFENEAGELNYLECPQGQNCTEVEEGDPAKVYFPIPIDEIRLNPMLEQNEGYL